MLNLKGLFLQEKSLKERVLAVMLIITLTLANVMLLGMYIGSRAYRNKCK
ncbi:MAG: hypothetical protein FWC68_01925 [Oscillospiraceae bacterium]|nr:hypothetical protein [Oscillospiraceae bacterium]